MTTHLSTSACILQLLDEATVGDGGVQPVERQETEVRMAADGPRSGCAINAAVEALGDPWSLIVLRDMIFGNRRSFRELLTRSDEGIASNILSSRLRSLVDAGLLTKAETVRGQRGSYSLTEPGIETFPVIVALGTWRLAHRAGTPASRR